MRKFRVGQYVKAAGMPKPGIIESYAEEFPEPRQIGLRTGRIWYWVYFVPGQPIWTIHFEEEALQAWEEAVGVWPVDIQQGTAISPNPPMKA